VKQVLDLIRQIIRTQRVSSRAAEKELGISSAQLLVLQRLEPVESLSLNELSEQTQTHQSSTSVVVSKLVSRGLLARTRSKGDARRLVLTLTPKARLLVRKTPHEAHDRLVSALARLSKAELKQLAVLLGKLAAAK
jgi:DNA-binding MarR family transcriptional regulator